MAGNSTRGLFKSNHFLRANAIQVPYIPASLACSIVLVLYLYDKKCHRIESIVGAYKGVVMMVGTGDREDCSIAKETSSLFAKQWAFLTPPHVSQYQSLLQSNPC